MLESTEAEAPAIDGGEQTKASKPSPAASMQLYKEGRPLVNPGVNASVGSNEQ